MKTKVEKLLLDVESVEENFTPKVIKKKDKLSLMKSKIVAFLKMRN